MSLPNEITVEGAELVKKFNDLTPRARAFVLATVRILYGDFESRKSKQPVMERVQQRNWDVIK